MKSDKKKEEKEKQENTKNKYDRDNFIYDEKHDRFICPEGKFLKLKQKNKYQDGVREYKGTECKKCPFLSSCCKGTKRTFEFDFKLRDIRSEMRTKLNTDEGKQKYNERITEVEPVMADIKRNQNFPEFLCRGKKMAFVELGLASSAHNIKKMFLSLKSKGIKRKEVNWNSLIKMQTA
jgi:transposase